jgi:hypothetical protein
VYVWAIPCRAFPKCEKKLDIKYKTLLVKTARGSKGIAKKRGRLRGTA